MSKPTTVELKKVVAVKAKKITELFSSRLGAEVVAILKHEFDKEELRSSTVENTYFNLGQRDVLVYLQQMINHSEREDDDEKTK